MKELLILKLKTVKGFRNFVMLMPRIKVQR